MILIAAVLAATQLIAEGAPEPDGYRMDNYRDPVPDTLAGATVVDTEEVRRFRQSGEAVLVDVFPRPPKPENLPKGTLWIDRPRVTIEGAVWLPNTGYGRMPKGVDDYFRKGLAAATGGNLAKPVVFFCQANCWMSWNAARRAMLEYGYSQVYWYPDGMDAWTFEEMPTVKIQPWAP